MPLFRLPPFLILLSSRSAVLVLVCVCILIFSRDAGLALMKLMQSSLVVLLILFEDLFHIILFIKFLDDLFCPMVLALFDHLRRGVGAKEEYQDGLEEGKYASHRENDAVAVGYLQFPRDDLDGNRQQYSGDFSQAEKEAYLFAQLPRSYFLEIDGGDGGVEADAGPLHEAAEDESEKSININKYDGQTIDYSEDIDARETPEFLD